MKKKAKGRRKEHDRKGRAIKHKAGVTASPVLREANWDWPYYNSC